MHIHPLKWALPVSVALHFGAVSWASQWTRPHEEPDLASLNLVSVDPATIPDPLDEPPAFPLAPAPKLAPPTKSATATSRHAPQEWHAPPASRPRLSPASPSRPAARPLVRLASNRSTSVPASTPRSSSPRSAHASTLNTPKADKEEVVPEGPVDLSVDHAEEDGSDAVETTEITKKSLIASNIKVKGQLHTAFTQVKPFNGPGVIAVIKGLKIPLSAPPGAVYPLEVTGSINDIKAEPLPFTLISGSVTILPTKTPLPTPEKPSLKGSVIGVGMLFAHRGDKVRVEIFAGDGIKGVAGVDLIVKYGNVRLPHGKKLPTSAPPKSTSPSSLNPAPKPASTPTPPASSTSATAPKKADNGSAASSGKTTESSNPAPISPDSPRDKDETKPGTESNPSPPSDDQAAPKAPGADFPSSDAK